MLASAGDCAQGLESAASRSAGLTQNVTQPDVSDLSDVSDDDGRDDGKALWKFPRGDANLESHKSDSDSERY